MTQPAKVQEPSMEEILASIRRIIADDEAKPPAAEKPASPARRQAGTRAAPRPVMKDIPPSAIAPRAASRPPPKPAPPPPHRRQRRPSATARTTSTRCSPSLDAATPEAEIRPRAARRATCSNSPTRWRCRIRRRRRRSSKIEPAGRLEFTEAAARRTAAGLSSRRRSKASRRRTADPVALDRLGGRIRLQFAGQYRAEQQCADAGRPGQGNAAADAEILARRQSAGTGGADRQGRNRAGFARRR